MTPAKESSGLLRSIRTGTVGLINILFVCTGNICRSPMAEAIAAASAGDAPITWASAGLAALVGSPASPHAVAAAREWGGDATGHAARQVDEGLIRWADRICVMTGGHLSALLARHPMAGEKSELLDPSRADITDPFGHPFDAYRTTAGRIAGAIEQRLSEWLSAAGAGDAR